MQLFLSILSTIGFIVLIILAVIAALIALILFFPVVYKAKIKKTEEFLADGSVKWLFGVFTLRFAFKDKRLDWSMKLFGFSLDKLIKKDKKENSKNEKYTAAKKQPTIKPGEIVHEEKEDMSDKMPKEPLNTAVKAEKEEKLKSARIEDNGSDKNLLEKIRFTFSNICAKLKKIENGFELFEKVKPDVKKLLKHVLPKNIKGYIAFGFSDPADTGMLLGILGALCIPIPKHLSIEPDFNEKKFECDVKLSERIIIIVLIIYIVRLLKVPEIKKLLGFGNKNKGKHKGVKRKKNDCKKSKHKEAK